MSFSISYGAEYETVYQKQVLDNGLTVVARYVPGSELVTIRMRVLSGLSNEGEYAGSGISHFLEHLLFKGTKDESSEEIRSKLREMGGLVNASTGYDSAEYYITVPNKNFEEALTLLTSVVMDPVFSEEEFKGEKEVILQEMKLHKDDPLSSQIRLLFSQAYKDHVYKYPIIGYEELFTKLTPEDLRKYHDAVYTPERIVLGVVGGVPYQKVFKEAKEVLSGYERQLPPAIDIVPEPKQVKGNETRYYKDIPLGYIAIGFHSTGVYSPDVYAGDVLSVILTSGQDSRLYKRLVNEKELLYTISGMNYTPRYPGLFVITGIGDPSKLDEAKEEIFAVIEEFKNGKINKKELERAKNLMASSYLHSHEKVDNIANFMTESQIITGDPAFFEKYVDRVAEVKDTDVLDNARKYLTKDNSTTILLLPKEFEEKTPVISSEMSKEDFGLDEKYMKLENGLKIVIKRRSGIPIAAVTYAAGGGLRVENENNNGISNLMVQTLLKSTKRRKEEKIVPLVERMGGAISAFSGLNSMGVTIDVPSAGLKESLDILEDVIKNADFPEEQIEQEKEKVAASIEQQENDVFEKGMNGIKKVLYKDHPYGMPVLGTRRSVRWIQREELMSFYKKYFTPGNSVITVVGDVDIDQTLEDLRKRFSKWEGEFPYIPTRAVAPLDQEVDKTINMFKEQSVMLVGFQGTTIKEKDRFSLDIISSVLSGSDGLLFESAREKGNIAYAQAAINVPEVDRGYFVLFLATIKENLEKARGILFDVIKEMSNGEISDKEITAAKNKLITQHAYSIETNSSLSLKMALDELYGLGYRRYKKYPDLVDAITKEDVTRAAKSLLDLNKCAVVEVESRY